MSLPTAQLTESPVSSLVRHWNLLWQFTLRNVEIRHKGSHLGLLWSFLSPLLMLALYVLVFGYIFGGRFGVLPHETRTDYALGLFVGLAVFNFLAETIAVSPIAIAGNPNFVKKVVFPLEILPAAGVGSSLFHLLTTLGLALAGIALVGPGLAWQCLWLPIILLPTVLLALGLAWLISALSVFWRDIAQVTQFAVTALMFASAVFYPTSRVPPEIWSVLRFNPILQAVDLSRNCLMWHQSPGPLPLAYLCAAGCLALLTGQAAFRRLRGSFADVL